MTIILTSVIGIGYGQNNLSSELNIYDLNGTWITKSKWNDKNIVFNKTTNVDKKYVGPIIKFENNGKVISAYSLNSIKCGNDSRLKPKRGNWNFNKESLILKSSVPIANYGTEFKILELNSSKLILNKLLAE